MDYNNSNNYDPNMYNNNAYNNYEPYSENNGKKGMAIASMVLGIIALVTCICYCSAIPLGIVSIILAIIVLVKHKNGKGFAITGIITSAIGIIISIVTIALAGPVTDNMNDLIQNADVYVQEYTEDGTIPESVLDMFNGNEELANQFMQGFSSGYED